MEVTGYDLRQTKQEAERAIDRAVSDLRYDLERRSQNWIAPSVSCNGSGSATERRRGSWKLRYSRSI